MNSTRAQSGSPAHHSSPWPSTACKLGLVLLIALAAVAVAGCGTKMLNTGKAETEIKKGIVAQTGVAVTAVKCPSDVEIKKDDVFKCAARGADGSQAPVTVTQTDDKGNIKFAANLVDQSRVQPQLQSEVERQTPVAVTAVDCPDVVELQKGKKFDCKLTSDNGDTASATVTLEGEQGGFTFKLN